MKSLRRCFLSYLLLGVCISCNTRPPVENSDQAYAIPQTQDSDVQVEDLNLLDKEAAQLELDSEDIQDTYSSLVASQNKVVSLEKELKSIAIPSEYFGVEQSLNEELITRDTFLTNLTENIEAALEKLNQLQQKVQNFRTLLSQSESKPQEPTEILLKLESKLLELNDFFQEISQNNIDIQNAIAQFSQEVESSLSTPTTLGPFQFNPNNPIHFQSICKEGGVSQFDGRTGQLVDQILLSCSAIQLTPIGGNGGDPIATPLDCGPAFVGKGIFGTAGDSLDSVGLICTLESKIDSPINKKTDVMGNINGGEPYEIYCPARTALVGVGGTLNQPNGFITRIFPICKKISFN